MLRHIRGANQQAINGAIEINSEVVKWIKREDLVTLYATELSVGGGLPNSPNYIPPDVYDLINQYKPVNQLTLAKTGSVLFGFVDSPSVVAQFEFFNSPQSTKPVKRHVFKLLKDRHVLDVDMYFNTKKLGLELELVKLQAIIPIQSVSTLYGVIKRVRPIVPSLIRFYEYVWGKKPSTNAVSDAQTFSNSINQALVQLKQKST